MSILCSMVGATYAVVVAEVIRKKKGITAVGNAQIDTAQVKIGGASALFDGTGDYLLVGLDTTMALGAGDWTIEMWVRLNSTGLGLIYDARPFSTNGLYPTIYTDGGRLKFFTNSADRIQSNVLSTGTWYHLAVVKSSGSTKLYIDGTQQGSTYTDSNTYINSGAGENRPMIGAAGDSAGGAGFNGWLDELRVSTSARYTTTFTPSTTAFVNDDNTVLLIHADGTDATTFFEDDNGLRAPIALIANGNAQVDTAQSKFGGASYLGDGTGDYLRADGTISIGTGDFTIEMWARHSVVNTGQMYMDCRPTNVNGAYPGIFFLGSNSRPYYYFNTNTRITADSAMSANTWYHIAIVRASGVTKMYIGGTAQTTTYTDSSSISYSIAHIGASNDPTPAQSLNGWIDEVRVSNTARYTTNFTPSTTAFVNDTNTLMLVHMDGTDASTVFRDDNGSGRASKGIQAIGNAQIDTAQSQFSGASALFDGTGDYLTTYIDSIGTGNFTLECWFRPAGFPRVTTVLNARDPDTTAGFALLFDASKVYFGQIGGNFISGTTTLSNGTWYHVAVSRSGTSMKMFLNGTQEGSTATNSTNFTNTNFWVGRGTPSPILDWNGHIDEVRVSNIARYTANFTTPTAPFQNDTNTLLLMHMDGTDASTVFLDDNGRNTTP